ncbi:MAG: phosphoribosylformylglycinamidine synthase I [Rickettsiales bacterium]|nr:phosphoribosylformylglycinamidine synthase I [Rickettsiales bacterium]|tara:strand:+ start:266 stop:946 length:681 start_codon:yes stop_codon:yes gene_type:complete
MKISIIVFPGSNCDQDIKNSLISCMKITPKMVWYLDEFSLDTDLVIIPGGFSYGDYLRSGAIASKSSIMKKIISISKKGIPIFGICNGFQILTEANLLPGTLVLNNSLKFICRNVFLQISNNDSLFSKFYKKNEIIELPIAHKMGNFRIRDKDLSSLIDNNQIIMRYCSMLGVCDDTTNPNGSIHNIAGLINKEGNIFGMMPHPERYYNNINKDLHMQKIIKSLLS